MTFKDPALLFAEFLGVIKGSEEALRSSSGVLTSDEYFALSGRKGATFATQRETVYQLYEKYQTIKAQRRDWDAADR